MQLSKPKARRAIIMLSSVLFLFFSACEKQQLLISDEQPSFGNKVINLNSKLGSLAAVSVQNAIENAYPKILEASSLSLQKSNNQERELLYEALADANIELQAINLEIQESDFPAIIDEYQVFDFDNAIASISGSYSQNEINVYVSTNNINNQGGDLQAYIDETRSAIQSGTLVLTVDEIDRILPFIDLIESTINDPSLLAKATRNGGCKEDIVGSAVSGALWGAVSGLIRGCTAGWIGGPGGAAAGCIVGFVGGAVVGTVTGAAQGAIACHIMK